MESRQNQPFLFPAQEAGKTAASSEEKKVGNGVSKSGD